MQHCLINNGVAVQDYLMNIQIAVFLLHILINMFHQFRIVTKTTEIFT